MPFFTLAFGIMATGVVVADPRIHMEPRRPLAFTPGAGSPAEEQVWSAVVLASNVKKGAQPASPPPELAPFVPKLAKFFGYDQFKVLGSATKTMDEHIERWLVPTQNFWVCAKTTREGGGYRLNMEFFHDKRRILQTEAMLGPKSPIFIRGPMHPSGQILFVFEVKP